MKVVRVFATNMSSTFRLATMILPQFEKGNHCAGVVGMMFFDDNIFQLCVGDPISERLPKAAREKGIPLLVCDQCAVPRGLADGTFEERGSGNVKARGFVDGVVAGCFPQFYAGPKGVKPDQVITP